MSFDEKGDRSSSGPVFDLDRPSLKFHLAAVLSANPPRKSLKAIAEQAIRVALALVRTRRSTAWAFVDPLMSDRDVAVDCLADAFRRDETGALPEFADYFNRLDWGGTDDADAYTAFRKFVFRQTLDGVYRMHGERDPQLARLIRNLKLAIAASDEVVLYKRGTVAWIRLSDAPATSCLEPIPLELLERRICVCEGDLAPELLSCVVRVLRYQTLFAPETPLTGLAVAIRNALTRSQGTRSASQEPSVYERLSSAWVREGIRAVSARVWPSYEEKVSRRIFLAYQEAAFLVIVQGFCHSVAVGRALGVSTAEYRERHRNAFEYLMRQYRKRLQAEYLTDLSAEAAL